MNVRRLPSTPSILGLIGLLIVVGLLGCPETGRTAELSVAKLTGTGTTPAAPAELVAGSQFTVAGDGEGRLEYPDGSRLALKAGTRGELTRHGIVLILGEVRMEFRKQGKEFRIKTPKAFLAVMGTTFDLSVGPDTTEVRLYEGRLAVNPRLDGRIVSASILEAGQHLTIIGNEVAIKPLVQQDAPADTSLKIPDPVAPPPSGSTPGTTPDAESKPAPEEGDEETNEPVLKNPFLEAPIGPQPGAGK